MSKLYRSQKSKQGKVNSFPILLVDGTSSMNYEYEFILDPYNKHFGDLGLNKLEYQWEDGLFSIQEQLRCAGWGDITKTFLQIFDILLKQQIPHQNGQKFPRNITIIFVSDGQEKFDIDQLIETIQQVTAQYLIQFISISIGGSFPNSISNNLRKRLHNQISENCIAIYKLERNHERTDEGIQNFFFDTFKKIREQLSVSSEILKCNKPVKKTIISQPEDNVQADQLFLSDTQVLIDGEVAQETNSLEDTKTMIMNSVSEALVNYGSTQNEEDVIKEFKEIQMVSKVICPASEDKALGTIQDLVQQVVNQEVELKMLSEDKLTKLQSSLTDPETISQIVTQISVDPNTLEQTQIVKSFKKKFGGCFTRSKSFCKQVDDHKLTGPALLINLISEEIKETFQKYKKKFQLENPKDCKAYIQEFFAIIQGKLKELGNVNADMIDEQTNDQALLLNKVLEQIHKLLEAKVITSEQAIKTIDETNQINLKSLASQSSAITDESDDYKYLPFFQKQEIDDDWENVLFVIFDNSDTMKEFEIAVSQFDQIFSDIDQDKVIQVYLRNSTYTINRTQQLPSFIDVIKSLEQSLQLRKKKIFVCVVSDGQTEYKTLHNSIKIAKKNYNNIKLVYVAIGMNFKAALENDLLKKSQTSDNKGRPKIYTIPRKQNVQFKQSVNNQPNTQPFEIAFTQIRELLFKEKEIIKQRPSFIAQQMMQNSQTQNRQIQFKSQQY